MSANSVAQVLFFLVSITIGAIYSGSAQAAESSVSSVQRNVAPPKTPVSFRPGDVFRDCDDCPQLVVIPAGRFEMGSNRRTDEKPPHPVDIPKPFAFGVYEVTVDEWNACLRAGGCKQSPEQGEGKLPIANVSWENTQNYLKWLSDKTGQKYRLPSEAEWEYAARAGTATRYWWGNDKGLKKANCTDCGSPWDGNGASPVGSFKPNPFGLYDVHGNVWEWTQDCWNPSYNGAPSHGEAWISGDCLSRVLRGGSWALDHEYMSSARRLRYDRDVRYYLNGFRVVRELPEPAIASEAPAIASEENGDMPFVAAILDAANKLFSHAPKPAPGSVRQPVVIDPLIDGLSGAESVATRTIKSRIVELVRSGYKQFEVKDFSPSNAVKSPFVIIGTFTGVNKQRKTSGVREAYRICLALLDLTSGKVASKAKVFSQAKGVDITPTAFFRDSPAWTLDPSTQAYIKTCQGTKLGDPIEPLYLDTIRAGALISEAIDAYEKGQFKNSQDLFRRASQSNGGNQLSTYNGLYLTSWKLGERNQAEEEFGKIVDYGLNNLHFGVKFRFRPGSTDFLIDPNDAGQHDMWLVQIARQAVRRRDCLEIVGHANRKEPEELNQRLSRLQAQYIKRRLEAEVPELSNRMVAKGEGAKQSLIGIGTGDVRDALDRRIEFDATRCPPR